MNYLHYKHLNILRETFTYYQKKESLDLFNFEEILRGIKYLNRGFEDTPQLTELWEIVSSLIEKKWESYLEHIKEKLAYQLYIMDEDDDKWIKNTQDKYYEVCEQVDNDRERYECLMKQIQEELNKRLL